MNPIATERLTLDPVTAANAETLWRIMQSPYLRRYQDVPRIPKEEFAQRVAARPGRFDGRAAGRFEWLIVVSGTKTPIGWISLRVAERHASAAEIGYSIVAAARKQGYAAEAAAAVVDVAFRVGRLGRVDACCVPENAASRRLLERIGFEQTRVQKNGAVVRGRAVDICLYAMTRAQWERRGAAPLYGSSANSTVMPASENA